MNSINFNHHKDEILSGAITGVIKMMYIPSLKLEEIVTIKYRKGEILYIAKIESINFKRLNDISSKDAERCGFKSREEAIKRQLELNDGKNADNFCAVILWRKQKKLQLPLE